MSLPLLSDFADITSTLQEDPSSLSDFHAWVRANQSLIATDFSAGELLKLKRGSVQDVLRTMIRYRQPCLNCVNFPAAKNFESRMDFEISMKEIEKFVSIGIYRRIGRPLWFSSSGGYIGAEGFFKCTVCPAIWQISIPEKEENGSISRIA